METFALLGQGFAEAFTSTNLLLVFLGALIGTVIGMLPGIGPINAIAILIPITFALDLSLTSALIMFAGIYYGSQYGNSISAILLNVPGTSGAVATTFDGYPLAKQGKGGQALAMSAIASFIGGTISVVGLMLFAPVLAQWAIRFGPAEYFVLMIFALSTVASLAGRSLVKALIAAVIGLMVGSVGLDPGGSVARFTFGELKLLDGIDFVVAVIGFFAVTEVLVTLEETRLGRATVNKVNKVMISIGDFVRSFWTMIRSSVMGFLIGVLPGAGGTIAAFMAYTSEKQLVDRDDDFGKGDLRGVAAPESANNAATSGALIPLLTLGVPGSGTTAVMLAALIGYNVNPGPLFIQNNTDVFFALVASMYIGNIMLLVLNLPLVGLFARILLIPRWILMPSVIALSFVAVYAVNNSAFDLFLMTGIGVAGYFMRKLDIPLAPAILALVLGGLMENNLRRALSLSDGDWSTFVSSPVTIVLWILTVASLVVPIIISRIFGTSVKELVEDEPS